MNVQGRSQSGFSLLEVIVAFAIAAIALGVLSQIFGQGARNMSLSGDYDKALMLADSLLTEYGIDAGSEETSFSDASGQFEWAVSIGPYITRHAEPDLAPASDNNATAQSPLVQIDVTVGWERNGKTRSVNVSSLRFVADNDNASASQKRL